MAFKALHIIEPILKALQEEGYTNPTPIQAQAIPIVSSGKDLLGVAQTGTGKTAAFAIPILQRLAAEKPQGKRRPIRALVLTPTRELAVQIDESFKAYGRHLPLSSTVIFGGVNQNKQTSALARGVDTVIATPGRLLDLIDQGHVPLQHVEVLVLDEADRMLDMGFLPDIKRILHFLPKKRQSLFFSATMPPPISRLAHEILDHPERVEVTPPSSTVDMIDQAIYHVEKSKKSNLLIKLLEEKDIESALVFTRTKHGADVVTRFLERAGISAEAIHGNKAQNARQRALTAFKNGKTRVLVATDIAARGIDIDDLEYVFNYDISNTPETYVHRIGRTGRAGAAGKAISFCAPDEKPFVRDIERLIGKKIAIVADHPYANSERAHKEHIPAPAKHAPNVSKDVISERMQLLKSQAASAPKEHAQREHPRHDRRPKQTEAEVRTSRAPRSRDTKAHEPRAHETKQREPRSHEPRAHESKTQTTRVHTSKPNSPKQHAPRLHVPAKPTDSKLSNTELETGIKKPKKQKKSWFSRLRGNR